MSRPRHPSSMRRIACLVISLLCAVLAACGQVQDNSTKQGSAGGSGPGPASAFPVTIKHKFGSTTIKEPPKRIATIGASADDLDAAVALGVKPVAIVTQDQLTPDAKYPWLTDKIDYSKTKVINASSGFNPEQLAGLNLDMILATGDFNLPEEYNALSKIAPTIGYEREWGKQTWQEHVNVVGKSLGKPQQAQQLITKTENYIARIGEENPRLRGKTFTASIGPAPGKIFTLVSPDDFAVKLLSQLGLRLSPSVRGVEQVSGSPTGVVGFEQLDKLDADLMVLGFTSPDLRTAFESSKLAKGLEAVRKGTYTVVDQKTIAQLRYPSVLGIPYAMDKLRPTLEKLAKS